MFCEMITCCKFNSRLCKEKYRDRISKSFLPTLFYASAICGTSALFKFERSFRKPLSVKNTKCLVET